MHFLDELSKVGLIIGLHLTGSLDETWELANECTSKSGFYFQLGNKSRSIVAIFEVFLNSLGAEFGSHT